VQVRAGTNDDLPALTALYNHYVEHDHATFDITPFSVEQRRGWLAHYADSGPHRLLVADDGGGGDLLGYATSSRFRDKAAYDTSVETTIYVDDAAVGRGVGTALYTALFDTLRTEGLHRAYAGIALPNDASMALHRRFGFVEIGTYHEVGHKLGRYWDVCWLEKALG
jgi:phosphinothricin acetyltransferase